ncbi:TVP38/TMEM64 family protein [Acetobacter oeni]|nr:VTT domain-containing protein [Acetobacter oeni]MBB3881870.1 putative membrane protein YdjX (TVP38/TMEM64 family) [Acetobacter oeni]NHO17803.1 TVP38/TMEM64 family protein [Acetobacter oeni]GBR08680.1 hypothetical protein AA21952_2681 [Acetobacter oeni LMG 21952]
MHKASDPDREHDSDARCNVVAADQQPLLATLIRPAAMVLLLAAGAIAFREIPALRHSLDSTDILRRGVSGRLLFCTTGMAWCFFGLPRQVLCFAAGLAYGFWEGSALATVATVTGAQACFAWARWGGRNRATRRLAADLPADLAVPETRQGMKARLAGMKQALLRHPFISVMTLRLLPVGSSLLLNLFAGLSGVAALPFAAATLVGSLPQTMIFVLLGAGAKIDGPGRILLAIALFAVSGALGVWLLRRTTSEFTPVTPETTLSGASS